jgi:hypothetical protein
MVKDVPDCAGGLLAEAVAKDELGSPGGVVLADSAGCADEHPATAMTAARTAMMRAETARIRMVVPLCNW